MIQFHSIHDICIQIIYLLEIVNEYREIGMIKKTCLFGEGGKALLKH